MPYVAVAGRPRDELLDAANRRWKALVDSSPELEAAVRLQRQLLNEVIDLMGSIEGARLPRLSLPSKYLAAKLARGVPAFAGEPIPLPTRLLGSKLVQFCELLAKGGAGEVATHIRAEIESGRMDAGSVLTASMSRDQAAIRAGATHRGLSPDMVWLVAELAVGPVAYVLQRTIFATSPQAPLADELAAWNRGYCPACGSWPALAEVVDAHRLLRCSFCSSAWELTTYGCIYCQEQGDRFVTAAPNADRPTRRLELCAACGGYLKAAEVEEMSPFPLMAIADMDTMDLDVAAVEHRYGRPPMKEFTKHST